MCVRDTRIEHTYAWMHGSVDAWMHERMYVRLAACLCVCLYACRHSCMYTLSVRMYTLICMCLANFHYLHINRFHSISIYILISISLDI